MPKTRIPLKTRFNKYFKQGKKNECWPWLGDCDVNGYGRILIFKNNKPYTHKNGTAHRVSFEIFNGPITKGLFVLHKCDNRKCVNPNHLYLGTHKDNMRDRSIRNRHIYGEKSPIAKLTEKDIEAICRDKRYQYVIASDYNVTQSTISKVKLRNSWQHITYNGPLKATKYCIVCNKSFLSNRFYSLTCSPQCSRIHALEKKRQRAKIVYAQKTARVTT